MLPSPSMSSRGAAPLLVAVACVAACVAETAPIARPTYAISCRVGGARRVLPAGPEADAMECLALREQAARDLSCPPGEIHAEERVLRELYVVEGCGRRGAYLRVDRAGVTRQAPGFGGKQVRLTIAGFVPLAGDDAGGALADLARDAYSDDAPDDPASVFWNRPWHYEIPGEGDSVALDVAVDRVRDWQALAAAGARDLACPRADIVAELRGTGPPGARTPVAEGCGRRAVYLRGRVPHAFDLASLVPTSRP